MLLYLLLGLGIAAAIGAGVWYIDHNAVERTNRKWETETAAKQAERTALLAALAVDLGDAKQQLYEQRQATARVAAAHQEELERMLHAYVPSGSACLRVGFVRYTDAAASGMPLDARPDPGLALAPANIGDDAAAATIARNYAKYHACTTRVADILKEFDALRTTTNAAVARANGTGGTGGTGSAR